MEKIKISKPEAYSRFVDGDFEMMDYETQTLFDRGNQLGKKTTSQFFYLKEKDVVLLEIYWDNEKIYEISFG